jgi:hypothetical protein
VCSAALRVSSCDSKSRNGATYGMTRTAMGMSPRCSRRRAGSCCGHARWRRGGPVAGITRNADISEESARHAGLVRVAGPPVQPRPCGGPLVRVEGDTPRAVSGRDGVTAMRTVAAARSCSLQRLSARGGVARGPRSRRRSLRGARHGQGRAPAATSASVERGRASCAGPAPMGRRRDARAWRCAGASRDPNPPC